MIDKEREKIDNQKKTKHNTKRRKDRQKKEIMPANTNNNSSRSLRRRLFRLKLLWKKMCRKQRHKFCI